MEEARCSVYTFSDGGCISRDVTLWRDREYCRKHLEMVQKQAREQEENIQFINLAGIRSLRSPC